MIPFANSQMPGHLRVHPGILVIGGLLALSVIALGARFCLDHGLTYICPSISLFGLPCPGCGGTRALASLAQLEIVQAVRFNPFLVLAMAALLLLPLRRKAWDAWTQRTWSVVGALFFLNWLYLILFLPR